jgi:flagellar assembly protein FliH
MGEVRKYAFDTEFAPDGTVLRDVSAGVRARLTAQEVEAERAAAFRAGQQDSLAAAERASAEAAQAIVLAAQSLLARLDEETRLLRREAAEAALATARAIAGAALEEFGEARAAAAASAAMEMLPMQPRFIVRVASALADGVRTRLEAAAQEHAFAGALLVRGEDGLAKGDVAIDWSDGAVIIERADIEARARALVEAALTAPCNTEVEPT